MTDQQSAHPATGEERDFTFTAIGGKTVTVTYDTTWDYGLQPCVGVDEVLSILDAWQGADAAHRQFLWPSTERNDDDAIIAYLWEGRVVLDSWKIATETDRYSLDDLPGLLPSTHYTLAEADKEPEGEQ